MDAQVGAQTFEFDLELSLMVELPLVVSSSVSLVHVSQERRLAVAQFYEWASGKRKLLVVIVASYHYHYVCCYY